MEFINRVLRLIAPATYLILVNGEEIGTVTAPSVQAAKTLATVKCNAAERDLDDFFFEIGEMDEDGYRTVIMAARGSGRVISRDYTSGDPFSFVEAAREAQAFTLEERLGEFGLEWQREQEERLAWR